METQFTEQQSLAVINEMINRARNNFQKGNGNSIIFYGCYVAFVALLNFILLQVLANSNQPFWVWTLMIPGVIIGKFVQKKTDRSAIVRTHIDSIVGYIWTGFLISIIVLLTVIFGIGFAFKNNMVFMLITPVILIMTGLGIFATAKAYRFSPYCYGAVVFWLGAIACLLALLIFNRGDLQFLILAACMILGYVIPGCILNKKAKENV